MQDLRPVPVGGAGHVFGGGSVVVGNNGVVDRRLRPQPHHHHHHQQPQQQQQQSLKCPRCDSHNTKFCYYNNYNLSQPRHFCKSCRRYWTKGGVLRNVPIGGGCRKSKRSSSSSSSSKPSKPTPHDRKDSRRSPSSSSAAAAPSHSGSDSSGLTATNAADSETPGPPGVHSYPAPLLEPIHQGPTPPTTAAEAFPEAAGFTSLVAAAAATTTTNADLLGLRFGNAPPFHPLPPPPQQQQQPRVGTVGEETRMPGGFPEPDRYVDQVTHMDLLPPPLGRPDGSLPVIAFDWQGGLDAAAGLFAGDLGGYWNHNQWGEIDPSFFLP